MAVTRSRTRKVSSIESHESSTDDNNTNTNNANNDSNSIMKRPTKRRKLSSSSRSSLKVKTATIVAKPSNLTLQQLFDKSYVNEPIDWSAILARTKSHPEEIESKHLYNALMIYNPTTVPPHVIRQMIQRSKKNIYSFSALQFAFTCPWVNMETVKALMDGPRSCLGFPRRSRARRGNVNNENDSDSGLLFGDRSDYEDSDIEIENENETGNNVIIVHRRHNNNNNGDNDSRSNSGDDIEADFFQDAIELIANAAVKTSKLHNHCSNLLHSLYESCESPPPRFDAVKVMLKHIPKVLEIQDHSDRDLPIHSACWSEKNTPFIELFVQTAVDIEDPVHRFGGLLVDNDYRISPMALIIQKWSDDSGATMIEKLIRMARITNEAITESKILFVAIKEHKWQIVKAIVKFAPECLAKFDSQHNLPLHKVCTLGRAPVETTPDFLSMDIGIVQFMVEQSMLNNTNGPAVGGLLAQDWSGKTPLQLLNNALRNRLHNPLAKEILKNILKFIAKKIHGKNKAKNLGLVLHEAIRIKSQELISIIIKTQPNSLQYKDEGGNLPIHALSKTDANFDTMKLIIEQSLKQKYGVLKNRGGLYVTNNNRETAIELILGRKCSSNGRVFKLLQGFKPKLITKKDIKDLKLLQKVADGGRPAIAKALLKLFPGAIALKDENGDLPLHIACKCNVNSSSRELINIFMEHGMKDEVGGEAGFGGLYIENNDDKTPMDLAIINMPYGERKWSSISIVMGHVPSAPVLHSFISQQKNSIYIKAIIEKFPESVHAIDTRGQLPIHLALTKNKGMSCETSLKHIIESYPAGLDVSDPVTGLLPFALAATGSYSLTFQYYILRKSPTFFSTKQWLSELKQSKDS